MMDSNKKKRAKEITEYFRPMAEKVQQKIAEYYGYLFAKKIDKIDGFDVSISIKVDVYPSKSTNSKLTAIRYEHEFVSREFLTPDYRKKLNEESEKGI